MMKDAARSACLLALFCVLAGCDAGGRSVASNGAQTTNNQAHQTAPDEQPAARNEAQVIHVFVALCDNVHQGIVPVAPSLGNGDAPARNLYWGAAFGVKTFFSHSKDWQLVAATANPQPAILERCVFKHRRRDAYLIADAYRGREIKQTIMDFLSAAAGKAGETIQVEVERKPIRLHLAGSARLVAYVGHDGLMDFSLASLPERRDDEQ